MQHNLISEDTIVWYMPLTFTFQEKYNQIQAIKLLLQLNYGQVPKSRQNFYFSWIKDKFLNLNRNNPLAE